MSKSDSIKFMKSGDVYVGMIRIANITEQRDLDDISSLVFRFLDKHESVKFILDFRHVQYLSSAVLGELVRIHRTVAKKSGLLRLCHLSSKIREIFEVTRLHEQFEIDATLRDALKELKAEAN